MKCVGRVSHLNSRNLAIVSTDDKVPKNTKIYDSEKRNIGRVVNIFGPVSEPFLAISPNKGMRITKIVGREVYKK
jgi:RNA-binding protein